MRKSLHAQQVEHLSGRRIVTRRMIQGGTFILDAHVRAGKLIEILRLH